MSCPDHRLVIGYGDRRIWSEAMLGRKPIALKLKPKGVIDIRALLRDGHTPQTGAERTPNLFARAEQRAVGKGGRRVRGA